MALTYPSLHLDSMLQITTTAKDSFNLFAGCDVSQMFVLGFRHRLGGRCTMPTCGVGPQLANTARLASSRLIHWLAMQRTHVDPGCKLHSRAAKMALHKKSITQIIPKFHTHVH